MKLKFLATVVFIVVAIVGTNAQQLDKKVSIDVKNQKIEEVFNYLNAEYGINFSYINNELPGKRHTLSYQDAPLREVLDELLAGTELGYVEFDNQVIIKRGIKKEVEEPAPEEPEPQPEEEEASLVEEEPQALAQDVEDSLAMENLSYDTIDVDQYRFSEDLKKKSIDEKTGFEKFEKQLEYFFTKDYDSSEYITMPYHFGIFYPLSTNGLEAGKYVNQLSLHLLVGFSAGLEGVEASLLGNIEKDYVHGFQYGGLFNVVGNDVNGAQISGLVNVVGGEFDGFQYADLVNLVNGSFYGVQFSPFMNLVNGEVTGFQGGGFMNVANGDVNGFQAAGFMNISSGSVKNGQVAGFMNISRDLKGPQIAGFGNIQEGESNGAQVAGFMNVAEQHVGAQVAGFMNVADEINGFQGAGFLNVARKVKGVQLGIINISDSLKGLPIGLISIVSKNGYFDLEMFYGDDFEANATIKIGAQKFHNIFGFSMEQLSYEEGTTNRWALGYGFGAQFGRKTLRLNTDLIGYHVFEKSMDDKPFLDNELNLLGKFKTLGSIHFGNFGIFAGPVFNVMVSQHIDDPESGVVGSSLIMDTFYNETFKDKTNVKMWIGYNVGIRF